MLDDAMKELLDGARDVDLDLESIWISSCPMPLGSPCPLRGRLPAERNRVRIRRPVPQQLVLTAETVRNCDQPSRISSNAAILIVAKVEKVSEIA